MRKTTKPKAKSEAIQAIEERLRAARVPAHMFHVKRVPPQIEISILFGSDRQKTLVRSKVNSRDIDAAIGSMWGGVAVPQRGHVRGGRRNRVRRRDGGVIDLPTCLLHGLAQHRGARADFIGA